MYIFGQLQSAQLENIAGSPALLAPKGRIWWDTATTRPRISDGVTSLEILTNLTALSNPMTIFGDIMYGGAGGAVTRLPPANTAGQLLMSQGTGVAPTWTNTIEIAPTGTGALIGVKGPAAFGSAFYLKSNGTGATAFLAMAANADDFVTGSVSHDLIFRTPNTSILFSSNSGTTIFGKLDVTGGWRFGSLSTASTPNAFLSGNDCALSILGGGLGTGDGFLQLFANNNTGLGGKHALLACIGTAGNYVTGSTAGDTIIGTAGGSLLFSGNTAALHGFMDSGGNWGIGPVLTSSATHNVYGNLHQKSQLNIPTAGAAFRFQNNSGAVFAQNGAVTGSILAYSANAANCAVGVGVVVNTNRSINAGGTVNTVGSDYAEYMEKEAPSQTIQKGEVVGVNAEGKLTKKFSRAIRFVVKSTDPSFVGGDRWANEEDLNAEEMEERRQAVDRIAFCGQVPCLVTGDFAPGDWILPTPGTNDSIWAIAVAEDSLSLKQFQKAIGQVWKVLELGKAWIAVGVK